MKRTLLSAITVLLCASGAAMADTFGTDENRFTLEFVTISGASNPASGYGIVNNNYRMGTYEITNDQWDKFVASVGGTVAGSPLHAYDESPTWTGTQIPTNEVSWYEAAQFANWLNISTGRAAAYKFTGTQGTSDYTFAVWDETDAGYNPNNPYRNSNAFYFLPTEDEWVKAAYWNGTKIQVYATRPGETLFQGNGTNGGWNFCLDFEYGPDGPASGPWDVGSGSEELNGTFDMMGNVWEWMESPYAAGDYGFDSSRCIRGGSYDFLNEWSLKSSGHSQTYPSTEIFRFGFRVASIPEPCTLLLLGLGPGVLRKKGEGKR